MAMIPLKQILPEKHYVAIKHGRVSVAQYLVSLGVQLPLDSIDVAFQLSRENKEPMRYQTWGWCVKAPTHMVCFLVENGVDIYACTETGDTAFHIVLKSCCEDEALEMVKLLVGYDCDPLKANSSRYGCDPLRANYSGETSFHIAIRRGHISVMRYLRSLSVALPPDILVTLDGRSWMTVPMVRFLLENGVDALSCTRTGEIMFHIALRLFDEDEALKFARDDLVASHGCDPLRVRDYFYGETSFHVAVRCGHISVVQYLLSLDILPPPDILLITCPRWDAVEMVHLLVENGADVHSACTRTGDTILHIALKLPGEELEMVKLLVGYGCDPLRANYSGITSFHIAIGQGHISVVRYLLSLCVAPPPDGYLY